MKSFSVNGQLIPFSLVSRVLYHPGSWEVVVESMPDEDRISDEEFNENCLYAQAGDLGKAKLTDEEIEQRLNEMVEAMGYFKVEKLMKLKFHKGPDFRRIQSPSRITVELGDCLEPIYMTGSDADTLWAELTELLDRGGWYEDE